MTRRSMLALVALLLVAVVGGRAEAVTTTFQNNLAGFNAAAGSPPISITFDALANNTDLTGTTFATVTFTSPDGNSLLVVPGSSTVSSIGDADNKLFPTTPTQVLSPGGTALVGGPALGQRDSLLLTFANPLSAFGLDILFESLDGASFASFEVRNASNAILASGSVGSVCIPSTVGPSNACSGGAWFLGFVSDVADIKTVLITDFDDNSVNPDANIGYDTFRFVRAEQAVPEPASLVLLASGALGLGVRALRRRG